MNKMVQGIIVVTDGRIPRRLDRGLAQAGRASPVGQDPDLRRRRRHQPAAGPLEIVDLRAPKIIRPEDAFKAVVEVTAEGMPDQPANMVLDVVPA